MIVEMVICFMAVIFVFALFLIQQADPLEKEKTTISEANTAIGQKLWTRIRKYANTSNVAYREPVTSKEVILAMAQKKVYWLEDKNDMTDVCKIDENRQWAQELIGSSCNKLDTYQSNVLLLQNTIKKYCDRIEKAINDYQVRYSSYIL